MRDYLINNVIRVCITKVIEKFPNSNFKEAFNISDKDKLIYANYLLDINNKAIKDAFANKQDISIPKFGTFFIREGRRITLDLGTEFMGKISDEELHKKCIETIRQKRLDKPTDDSINVSFNQFRSK